MHFSLLSANLDRSIFGECRVARRRVAQALNVVECFGPGLLIGIQAGIVDHSKCTRPQLIQRRVQSMRDEFGGLRGSVLRNTPVTVLPKEWECAVQLSAWSWQQHWRSKLLESLTEHWLCLG
jgi:hypothetical protein